LTWGEGAGKREGFFAGMKNRSCKDELQNRTVSLQEKLFKGESILSPKKEN